MLKRSLCILLSCIMLTLTGCGLSSSTKDKLFGDSDVTEVFTGAVSGGNFELADEYYESKKISQDLLNSCLSSAIYATDPYESIVYLLDKGADPNDGNIIWDLAYNARVEPMRALLTSDKIDLTKKNEVDHDALYMALENEGGGSEYYNYQVIKLLIDAGAEPYPELFKNNKTYEKEEPYSQLLSSPYSSKLVLEKLIENNQESGLKKACEFAILGETDKAVEECINNPNDYDEDEITLITTFLAYWGTPDECQKVCDIFDAQIYGGMLQYVVQTNDAKMINYIISVNEIDVTEKEWAFLLADAAKFDNLDACKCLIENNVFMVVNDKGDVMNTSGLSELYYAAVNNDLELFKLIYDYANDRGARITEEYLAKSLETSLCADNKSIIDFLGSEGYTFSAIDISECDIESVKCLEENGKQFDGIDLIKAVNGGDVEVVKYILDKGVDVNAVSEYDDTPLRNALISKNEILKLIIDSGADIPDNILQYTLGASKKNVKLMIDSGANTDLKFDKIPSSTGSFKNGEFSLKEYWEAYGRDDLVKLLK